MPEASERTSAERVETFRERMDKEVAFHPKYIMDTRSTVMQIAGEADRKIRELSAAAELARKAVGEAIAERDSAADSHHAAIREMTQCLIEKFGVASDHAFSLTAHGPVNALHAVRAMLTTAERELASLRTDKESLLHLIFEIYQVTGAIEGGNELESAKKLRAENTALREAAEEAAQDIQAVIEGLVLTGTAEAVLKMAFTKITSALAPAAGDTLAKGT